MTISLFITPFITLFSLACQPAQRETQVPNQGSTATGSATSGAPGSISGRVCASNGLYWLAGAMVYTHIKNDGVVVDTRETLTDGGGQFVLEDLPAGGAYDVFIQDGGEQLVEQETTGIVVEAGQDVVLDPPSCDVLDPLVTAIIRGDYDNADSIILPFGFPWVEVDGTDADTLVSFLVDGDLAPYQLIIVESGIAEDGVVRGSGETLDPVTTAVQDWVEQGGILWVTDWSYDLVAQVFPGYIDFVGDDAQADSAQVGLAGDVQGAISDAALAAEAGFDYLTLEINRPEWAVAEGLDPGATALVEGSVEYKLADGPGYVDTAPLLVRFPRGDGDVIYSSFTFEENDGAAGLSLMRAAIAQTVAR